MGAAYFILIFTLIGPFSFGALLNTFHSIVRDRGQTITNMVCLYVFYFLLFTSINFLLLYVVHNNFSANIHIPDLKGYLDNADIDFPYKSSKSRDDFECDTKRGIKHLLELEKMRTLYDVYNLDTGFNDQFKWTGAPIIMCFLYFGNVLNVSLTIIKECEFLWWQSVLLLFIFISCVIIIFGLKGVIYKLKSAINEDSDKSYYTPDTDYNIKRITDKSNELNIINTANHFNVNLNAEKAYQILNIIFDAEKTAYEKQQLIRTCCYCLSTGFFIILVLMVFPY